ncbi:MAG TPA: hypothetical protein DEO71_01315 [Chryseobacterium sp.]|nr:hypothetical protein [Chryseobacterium sp.]
MKLRSIGKYFFLCGIVMFPLSVIMFLIGAGMFTARGNFSPIVRSLAEFCFIFWLPFFALGIIFSLTGMIIYFIKNKSKD